MTATVQALFRYPLKSAGGQQCDALDINLRGVKEDRIWAAYLEDKIVSCKTTRRFVPLPQLLQCRVTGTEGAWQVQVPGTGVAPLGSDTLNRYLSQYTGKKITVRRETQTSHFDDSPLHIVTTATMDWLETLGSTWGDARRLRPNIVVDNGQEAFTEESWIGKHIAIGDSVVECTHKTERCIMVGMAQGNIPANAAILKTIGTKRSACIGVYGRVLHKSHIRQGDPVCVQ